MEDHARLFLLGLAIIGLASASPGHLFAQTMSPTDRLGLLYATKLTFTPGGDPIIRLGLIEDVSQVEFTPSLPISVLPDGEGGSRVDLPGGETYTVKIEEGKPGRYTHWVIVDRLPISERGRLEAIKEQWKSRGHAPQSFELGGLFAVKGKVFDSRQIIVAVGGDSAKKPIAQLARTLQAKHGIEGGIHSELVSQPSGTIVLQSKAVRVTVRQSDVLSVTALDPQKEEEVRYMIPGIKKSYAKGTQTLEYTGRLIFAPDAQGKLVLINSLGAERVLKGTVPAEIFASAPQPALQAQAIAARNEIFSALGVRNLAEPYMLRADIYDQVYGGTKAEDPRTSKAVDATRGKVMFWKNQIIEAFYSSNAGGHTEDNENVWDMEPRPYLRGRPDAPADKVPVAFRDGLATKDLDAFLDQGFEAFSKTAPAPSSKFFRWEKSVPVSEATSWLAEAKESVGKIKDVRILERGVSGRIKRLEIKGSQGKTTVERELNVRRLFGGLRSGLFLMSTERDSSGFIRTFHFRGAGFGHGVGMCQTGAIGMASKGYTSQQILTHYYSGIDIRTIY